MAELIGETLAANQDLQAALARLDQAEALLRGARADQYPTLSASGSAAEQYLAEVERTDPDQERVTRYQVGAAPAGSWICSAACAAPARRARRSWKPPAPTSTRSRWPWWGAWPAAISNCAGCSSSWIRRAAAWPTSANPGHRRGPPGRGPRHRIRPPAGARPAGRHPRHPAQPGGRRARAAVPHRRARRPAAGGAGQPPVGAGAAAGKPAGDPGGQPRRRPAPASGHPRRGTAPGRRQRAHRRGHRGPVPQLQPGRADGLRGGGLLGPVQRPGGIPRRGPGRGLDLPRFRWRAQPHRRRRRGQPRGPGRLPANRAGSPGGNRNPAVPLPARPGTHRAPGGRHGLRRPRRAPGPGPL